MPSEETAPLPLRLDVRPAQGEPSDRLLTSEPVVVGRAADAHLVVSDPFVSRHHARFFTRGGTWLVEDLGSSNGTVVDGERIAAPTRIGPGTVIELSGTRLTVGVGTEAGPGPASSRSETTIFRPATELLAEQIAPETDAGEEALRRQAARLQLLNEVHRVLGRPISLDELLRLILDRVFLHLGPEEAAIYLRRPDGTFERAAARARTENASEHPLHSRTLLEEVGEKALAALVLDTRTDERFAAAKSVEVSGVRSLVAAPLLDEDESLGLIVLGSRASERRFSRDDLEILVSLASVAALRLRNLSLARESAERRRLEAEVALARRIQVALLAERPPPIPGWEIHAGNLPSRVVSGDFYQILSRREGRDAVLLVADVSGKGMAAALLTATLEALAAAPLEEGVAPAEVCTRLSRQLFQRTSPERFATLFLGALETATGALDWSSAGHNPALVVRAGGGLEPLGATGVPLGLIPDAAYSSETVRLAPGDLLVVYTDGVVEATNPEDEMFGRERLEALLQRDLSSPLDEVAAALERDLEAFAAGVPFEDDRTLLLLRRQR